MLPEPPIRTTPVTATSALLVNSRGQYLLHLRDANKPIRQPGTWALPGGGCEPGETPDQAIARELLVALPDNLVPYTRTAVQGITAGNPYTEMSRPTADSSHMS